MATKNNQTTNIWNSPRKWRQENCRHYNKKKYELQLLVYRWSSLPTPEKHTSWNSIQTHSTKYPPTKRQRNMETNRKWYLLLQINLPSYLKPLCWCSNKPNPKPWDKSIMNIEISLSPPRKILPLANLYKRSTNQH